MSTPTEQSASLLAGCARVKITPPVPIHIAGFFSPRTAETVRDDLFASAVVLGDGKTDIAIVSCDLVNVDNDLVADAKRMILQECNIPPDKVLVCATHTHAGPYLRRRSIPGVVMNEAWRATIPRAIADAVGQACKNDFPATLRYGRTELKGYTVIRLYRLKSGLERFGVRGSPEDIVRYSGDPDEELQALSLIDEDGRTRAMIYNFAMHPVLVGHGSCKVLSADWPGEARRALCGMYGEDMVPVFLQGCCGDCNFERLSVEQHGRGVAGAVAMAVEREGEMAVERIGATLEIERIPYYTREQELYEQVARIKAQPEMTSVQEYLVSKFESWPHDGEIADVPIQTLQIGDLAIVALPGEVFSGIGKEIKRYSPAAKTMVVELSNAWVCGYTATTDQAIRNVSTTFAGTSGAYGTIPIVSRWLVADAGRRMTDKAIAQLWELF